MERKRKWISLNVKVNVVIIVIVLVLACGLAGIAYYVNGQRTDRYYKDSTAKMAAAVAHFVDGASRSSKSRGCMRTLKRPMRCFASTGTNWGPKASICSRCPETAA